eukprot:COSAG05_NODE_4568_length_1458_cov_1.214128_1_plen_96_part_10
MQKRRVRVKHEGLRFRRLATVWVVPPAPCPPSPAGAPVDIISLVAIVATVGIPSVDAAVPLRWHHSMRRRYKSLRCEAVHLSLFQGDIHAICHAYE